MDTKSTDEVSERREDHPTSNTTSQQIRITQGLIYGSPIPTFVIDIDHRVICWNKALEELTGIQALEVIGTRQQWRAFYAAKRPCMADLLVAEAYEGIEPWYAGKYSKSKLVDEAYEAIDFFPALGKGGRWLRFTAAAVRDLKGTLVGAVETLEDITERRNAERELKKAYDELEIRVQERTRDLMESSRALKAEVIERRSTEQKLKKRERELKIKSNHLREMNTALKVLLKQREEDKRDLEEKILANVKEVLLPYLEKIKRTNLGEYQLSTVNLIEANLKDIISPFIRSLTTKYINMTPREIQVAMLVKEGKTTKEIAELLHISTAAIDFHRNNLRIKLGLKNNKTGLRVHLMSYL